MTPEEANRQTVEALKLAKSQSYQALYYAKHNGGDRLPLAQQWELEWSERGLTKRE